MRTAMVHGDEHAAAEGARTRREERARREKGRIMRNASAPHTKLEDDDPPPPKRTPNPLYLPYI